MTLRLFTVLNRFHLHAIYMTISKSFNELKPKYNLKHQDSFTKETCVYEQRAELEGNHDDIMIEEGLCC